MNYPRLLMVLLAGSLAGCGDSATGPTTNPTPSLTSLSPSGATQYGEGLMLTVNGTNFVGSSVVAVNGNQHSTTFVESTKITALIPASDLEAAGVAQITVAAPTPGGGISNALPWTISASTPGTIRRVSITSNGAQANAASNNSPVSINADGRFVVFGSAADNLVPNDTNGANDIFVRDTCIGAGPSCLPSTTRVSIASDGTQANGDSFGAAISDNGRFIVFGSAASDLVSGDNNGAFDAFMRDTCAGAPTGCAPSTARVSLADDGSEANGSNQQFSISGDGRYIAFVSLATNLVTNDTNGTFDVFVRDTCVGVQVGCVPSTNRVSVASDGTQGNAESQSSAISADGRFVVFDSASHNLVANDTNTHTDIFVRDTCVGAPAGCSPSTIRASLADDGGQSATGGIIPSLSPDGRYVGFASGDNNLVLGDTNGAFFDLFLRDTCLGVAVVCTPSTIRVSVASDGTQGDSDSIESTISFGGRFVAFRSDASTLVPGDSNAQTDIFVHDTCIGAPAGCTPSTVRVSVAGDGTQGNGGFFAGVGHAITADGRFTVFTSDATNLVSGDNNNQMDVFLAAN